MRPDPDSSDMTLIVREAEEEEGGGRIPGRPGGSVLRGTRRTRIRQMVRSLEASMAAPAATPTVISNAERAILCQSGRRTYLSSGLEVPDPVVSAACVHLLMTISTLKPLLN